MMVKNIAEQSVQYVKGVGPRLAKILNKLGLFTVKDLFYYFPRAYEDRRFITKIKDLKIGQKQMFLGSIEKIFLIRTRYYKTIVKTVLNDGTGELVVMWFNQSYLANIFKSGQKLFVIGKTTYNPKAREIQLAPQEYEIIEGDEKKSAVIGRIVPKYSLTSGLWPKKMRRILAEVFSKFSLDLIDPLPENLKITYQLPCLEWSLKQIHFPENLELYKKGRARMVFEEFFLIQLSLMIRRTLRRLEKGRALKISPELVKDFKKSLPFELTGAQQRVLSEILADLGSEFPMKRLLQGDVGSGKTVVAAAAILAAAASGLQSALMAPTEILASQHFRTISQVLKKFKIKPVLLTAGLKAGAKKKALQKIKSGETKVIIGTHALIQEKVEFNALGLVIIDEQHRFGVGQRMELVSKGQNPDLLVMTATPIPRTLTLAFYGDLEQSVIDEMPPGRLPIKTYFAPEADRARVYEFVKKRISVGEQAFIVFPLVEESEKVDLAAATEAYQKLKKGFFKNIEIALLHGRMKAEEKNKIMKNFSAGKTKILVATTVVEVGLDVPQATVMIIEHAERFGLAVLHQLRGRVGRRGQEAYCILIGHPATPDSRQRIKAIVANTDGFKIAEIDLKLRGPGEVMGLRQSGFPEFKMADPVSDLKILVSARGAAAGLIKADPNLSWPENAALKQELLKNFGDVWRNLEQGN